MITDDKRKLNTGILTL